MLDDLLLFVDWAVTSFKSLWYAMGTWGIIGGFIISYGILRKAALILKKLWKGGI